MAYGHLESPAAMGRMPATTTFSYGQRGERADLSELLLYNNTDQPYPAVIH